MSPVFPGRLAGDVDSGHTVAMSSCQRMEGKFKNLLHVHVYVSYMYMYKKKKQYMYNVVTCVHTKYVHVYHKNR